METIDLLMIASRWIHIGAAIIAIGGAVFMRVALIPSAEQVLDAEEHQRLREAVRKRWGLLVNVCIGLLLITGGANFAMLTLVREVPPMPYHAIFGVKFLAAMGVFFLSSVLVGRSAGLARMRQDARKWLGILLALGALIVLLSTILAQIRAGAGRATETVTSVSAAPSAGGLCSVRKEHRTGGCLPPLFIASASSL